MVGAGAWFDLCFGSLCVGGGGFFRVGHLFVQPTVYGDDGSNTAVTTCIV